MAHAEVHPLQVTNRELIILATAAFVVAACAVLMTVSATPNRTVQVQATTDTLAVMPRVTRTGGALIDPQGPLTVRATGKVPPSVLLTCDMFKAQRMFVGNRAYFSSLPLGDCAVALEGTRPWQPVYPGDDLRCRIDDDATVCTGGLATSRAGRMSVESAVPAVLWVDQERVGPLPVRDRKVPVGRRALKLEYSDGRFARYSLVVDPDQVVDVVFPVPPGLDPSTLPAPSWEAEPPPRARRPSPAPPPPVASSSEEDSGPASEP